MWTRPTRLTPRSLFRDGGHLEKRIATSSTPSASARGLRGSRGNYRAVRRRRDYEAAATRFAAPKQAFRRLVPHRHENPAPTASRRSNRALSRRRVDQETVILDEEIRALKWKLWHGQVDRAIQQPDGLLAVMAMLREQGDLSAGRIWQLAQVLLTYIRQNKMAIVDYGARYRSGRRIASALAESAVNSVAARRMVKKQQMRWSSISSA